MWINWQTCTHARTLIREATSPSLSQRAGTAPGNPSSPWLPGPVSHRTVLNTCDERSPGLNAGLTDGPTALRTSRPPRTGA